MAGFIETDEFVVSEERLWTVWNEAVRQGWAPVRGTLIDESASVSKAIWEPGNALGARFELGPDVVGLHVYSDPSEPTAQLTLPLTPSPSCLNLVRAIEERLGVALLLGP